MQLEALHKFGLGRGVYSVREASRLTGVSAQRIRGWLAGYTNERRPKRILVGDYQREDGRLQLSFQDLVEIRFVNAFLSLGVSWPELRAASRKASEALHTPHPFLAMKFRTDGRRIFLDATDATGDRRLLHLRKDQYVFQQVFGPALKNLEVDGNEIRKWWPLGPKKSIVIDPSRCFGRPVAKDSGVPADILADMASVASISETAKWFDVNPVEVRHALEFRTIFAA